MKRYLAFLLAAIMVIGMMTGCNILGNQGNNGKVPTNLENMSDEEILKASKKLFNGREMATTYQTYFSSSYASLNYFSTSYATVREIVANCIDGLVEPDIYGVYAPSLAESWEYDHENLTYTFKIREDATWVKADGTEYAKVTAHDFVTAAKYILDAANASTTASIFYDVIAGAEAYYMGTTTPEEGAEPYPVMDWETVGVKALDDYTLQYTLDEACPYFLSMITYVCFMPVNADFLNEKGADFGVVLKENIKFITMKLEENDLSTKVRLMKVKEMVLKQAHDFHY